MLFFKVTAAIALSLSSTAFASIAGPVISANFPDPGYLKVGSTYYAFATNGNGKNIQIATSPDNKQWTVSGSDALPNVGSWATTGNTWAPDVIDRGDGTFVMYYAARSKSPSTQCVGMATANNPTGPYTPQSQPFACPASQGGAIDPAGFKDSDGTRWVVYKIDGNSLGGATCGPGGAGPHPTPIMLQQLASDGLTLIGSPIQVLDRGAADGPLIEAPALMKHGSTYFLFFSSNCYNTEYYDISYATASNVKGPYTKASKALLLSGTTDGIALSGPGGATPLQDGSSIAFHATLNYNPFTRGMFTAVPTFNGNVITL